MFIYKSLIYRVTLINNAIFMNYTLCIVDILYNMLKESTHWCLICEKTDFNLVNYDQQVLIIWHKPWYDLHSGDTGCDVIIYSRYTQWFHPLLNMLTYRKAQCISWEWKASLLIMQDRSFLYTLSPREFRYLLGILGITHGYMYAGGFLFKI